MISVITMSDSARFAAPEQPKPHYVRGAIVQPSALSVRQIGATPYFTRCSAMNRQISGVAGRTTFVPS